MNPWRIAVVGGGPTGSLVSMLLARAGQSVSLYEQRAQDGFADPSAGRSINLAIPRTSLQAMIRAGVDERIADVAVPLHGRIMHSRSGEATTALYEDRPPTRTRSPLHPSENPYSIERGVLNQYLIESAERMSAVTLRFRHRLVDGDLDRGRLVFERQGGSTSEVTADLIIGADGAHSMVRRLMEEGPGFGSEVRDSGIRYRELQSEPGADTHLAGHFFHLWPRQGRILVALPNTGGSFTFTLFEREREAARLAAPGASATLAHLLEREFPDLRLIPLSSRGAKAPEASQPLITVQVWPWHQGRAVLLGDACHALLPFAGRGTAEGLQDGLCLLEVLKKTSQSRLSGAFESYARRRKPETDALAEFTEALAPLLLALLPEGGLSAHL